MPGAEPLRLRDAHPQLHDRTAFTPVDAHYYYLAGWAARRIAAAPPRLHVDVGSQVVFANLLGAFVPVVFVDYRPLRDRLSGLNSVAGTLLNLPFATGTVESLSCLHVAEHVGLGRYGDPLDPSGTRRSAEELARVLAPAGSLYFAVPVGRPRVCFNAHRIHEPRSVLDYFSGLELLEFSAVTDDGRYHEDVCPDGLSQADYACGMFRFRKHG